MTTRTRLAQLVPVAALALALVGCGSSSKSSATVDSGPSATYAGSATTFAAAGTTAAAASTQAAGGAAKETVGPSAVNDQAATADPAGTAGTAPGSPAGIGAPITDGRKIVINMALEMEVADVAEAAGKVHGLAEGAGAQIFTEQTSLVSATASSTIVLKVPPAQVNSLLTSIRTIGRFTAQSVTSDDVTAQFVDLDARIESAQRSVARARDFLDKASDVNQLSVLEGELTRREGELEGLLGQKRVLENHVDLATITLTLKPAPPVTTTTSTIAPTTTTVAKPSVSRALHNGSRSVGGFLKAIAIVLAFLLPWSPFIVLGAVLLWVGRRRARRAAAARATAGPGGPTGYPQQWPPTPPTAGVADEPVPAGVGGRGASEPTDTE